MVAVVAVVVGVVDVVVVLAVLRGIKSVDPVAQGSRRIDRAVEERDPPGRGLDSLSLWKMGETDATFEGVRTMKKQPHTHTRTRVME